MSELSVGSLSGLAANSYVIDVASGSQLTQPGMILQVVSTTKTDAFSSTSTSMVDITGLTATITPTSASSKILVLVSIVYSTSDAGNGVRFNLVRDVSDIAIGTGGAIGNNTLNLFTASASARASASINFLDSPSTSSSTTYKIQGEVAANTFYVNRGASDNVSVSTITLMEIAG